jgi:hypothetical protein
MRNKQDHFENQSSETKPEEALVVVSVGNHTRLGDVLEYAVSGLAFETVETDDFLRGIWKNRRILFAISADATGENARLRALAAGLCSGATLLDGCVCAALADGASGGEAHLDTIRLLLAANGAGASVIAQPLLEGGRELKLFSGGKETPFERYRVRARALVTRLCADAPQVSARALVRFLTTLEGGAAFDWRGFLTRLVAQAGAEMEDIGTPDETILLCENSDGLPDEKTLSLLSGSGLLRLLIASPATGSELFVACLFERACLRKNHVLPPHAVLVFEGMSAVEAMASKAEMEKVNAMFR